MIYVAPHQDHVRLGVDACPGVDERGHGVTMRTLHDHWREVPKPVRRAVWIAWRRGAGAGTPAHRAAIRLAITALSRAIVPASPRPTHTPTRYLADQTRVQASRKPCDVPVLSATGNGYSVVR